VGWISNLLWGTPPPPVFVFGLDLGQTQDPTALAGLEIPAAADAPHTIRYLKRWPLGTPYPVIVAEVEKVLLHPQVAGSRLMVDQTGVGRAVVDMFRASGMLAITPVTITAGLQATRTERDGWHVPKKDLVAAVMALAQSRRLHISPGLAEGETLRKELANFRVKVTLAANEVFGAWREGQNDDCVLAAALCAWAAKNLVIGAWEPAIARTEAQGRSVLASFPRGVFFPGRNDDWDDEDLPSPFDVYGRGH
jgi:hypothetical protein